MKRTSIFIACLICLMTINTDASENYPQIEIVTTSGAIVVELDRNRAPKTVENFLNYVESGAYIGTIFHRVIPGFVIQTGGYDVNLDEIDTLPEIINESGNGLKNQRMSLGMARTNEPHSASSQFYINLNDNFSLDPMPTRWGYAVFGDVIDGFSVVDDIASNATQTTKGFQDVPVAPIIILEVKRID
ncbi:MAG TPA: peptidylprolyl isomerase [Gammaproteobacteria bacterium]|nr:peptidylprolyl isomerase [Gammaproteobacteria bacterium]